MTLPLPDKRHLQAAEGWLGLGDHLSANQELDNITPELRAHPDVLKVRYEVFSAGKKWDAAVEIARIIAKLLPDNPWGQVHLAFALHELKRTQEAYDTVRPVVDQFPQDWQMRYNLACYSCQLGNLKEAMEWLSKAMQLAGKKDIRQLALDDNDLQPLWLKIGEI